MMPLILTPKRSEREGRGDILARSESRNAWRRTRIRNLPEAVSYENVGEEAGMDGGDPQAAVDDCGGGSAGKPPPVREPQTCHFYLPNQVNFENHFFA